MLRLKNVPNLVRVPQKYTKCVRNCLTLISALLSPYLNPRWWYLRVAEIRKKGNPGLGMHPKPLELCFWCLEWNPRSGSASGDQTPLVRLTMQFDSSICASRYWHEAVGGG